MTSPTVLSPNRQTIVFIGLDPVNQSCMEQPILPSP